MSSCCAAATATDDIVAAAVITLAKMIYFCSCARVCVFLSLSAVVCRVVKAFKAFTPRRGCRVHCILQQQQQQQQRPRDKIDHFMLFLFESSLNFDFETFDTFKMTHAAAALYVYRTVPLLLLLPLESPSCL